MADKPSQQSSQRSRLAKLFLGSAQDSGSLIEQLTLMEILVGFAVTLMVTLLLLEFEFQSIPEYQIGDIADRTIEAPYDFIVADQEATLAREAEMRRTVPAVFDLDLKMNNRITAELRAAFAEARRLIAEERSTPGNTGLLSEEAMGRLFPLLRDRLPRFTQGDVLGICLRNAFSPELENQIVALVLEGMKSPGVILSRDTLLPYQEQGLILRNTVSNEDELLQDWTALRDLDQARDLLRQNEYQLTAVSGEEKKEIITFLENWIIPNVYYNASASGDTEQLYMQQVNPVLIQIKKGRTLVRAGDEIEITGKAVLDQLMRLQQPRSLLGKFTGIFLIVSFLQFFVWQYFLAYQIQLKQIRRHYLLLALVLCATILVTKIHIFLAEAIAGSLRLDSLQDPLQFYFLAPMALGAILTVLLIDVQVSVLFSLIFAVSVGLLTGELGMFVYSLTGSLAAIYLMGTYRDRAAIIRGGGIIGLVNVLTVLALQLYASETSFQWIPFLVRASCGILSGIFASMLASLCLPILEYLFSITTDIKLLELSNLNNPILRRLAVEAPGTYHHSIIVGSLAEAAAEAIGANTLLVRVGAYYHDIGKLKNPEYYVENQLYMSNKHETLSPSMSSLILASHVKDGLALAEEINLVPAVSDLIPEHHGTRLMKFFYQKAKDAHDRKEREVNEDDFRYPGPRPQSKEAAILMLADQVEAAARTLQDPSPSQIRSMIRRLIQSTIQDRQFDECDITMQDLDRILRACERVITGMHHHRIEYPGFDFNRGVEEEQFEQTQTEGQRIQ